MKNGPAGMDEGHKMQEKSGLIERSGEHPATHGAKVRQTMLETRMHQVMQPAKHGSHAHALQDFKRRFIVCIILTIPILALSPLVQSAFRFNLALLALNTFCSCSQVSFTSMEAIHS